MKESLARMFIRRGFLFAFTIAFLFIVSKNGLREVFYPTLPAEDGTFFFQIFYNQHELRHVFRFYSGYISILPHLLAYILVFLPIVWIPSAFALASLCITAGASALLYKLSVQMGRTPLFALYSVAIVSALPLGDSWIVGTLAYQSWNFTLILFLAILLPLPHKIGWRVPYIVFLHLAIWSHPLTVLIVPPLLYKILKEQAERPHRILLCLSAMIYYLWGTQHAKFHSFNLLETLQIFFIRVSAESAIGPVRRVDWAQAGATTALLILGFILTALLGIALAKQWARMEENEKTTVAMLGFYLIGSAAVAIVFRIQSRDLGMEYLSAVWGVQYTYLSKILFVFLFLVALKSMVWKEGAWRWIHLVSVVLLLAINANGKEVYQTREDNGRTVLKFVELIERNFPNCQPGEQKIVTLKKGDKPNTETTSYFHITIDICAPLKP
ncbi:MAG: hypothetical protein COV66_07235 [Nitrospinae bacterium CG11_big_fil_rev_8_21_14_0_20_45_15]|nr:MAG: hypothetical protein COV66_07235 [Nitrospinae bacterium CG11_big_fil_rev_8_21_14_0_20_45_15]